MASTSIRPRRARAAFGPLRFVVLCTLALSPVALAAQSGSAGVAGERADSLVEVRRPNGTWQPGWLVETAGDSVTIETLDGVQMQMDRRRAYLRPARGEIVEGVYWHEDRNLSRLFFAPTGRTLRQGEGYAGLFWFLPFVGYGVSDQFTLAGGIPMIAGTLAETPFYLAPKLQIVAQERRQVAVGAFILRTPDWDDDVDPAFPDGSGDLVEERNGNWLGIGYGVGSFGDENRALHVGGGVAVVDGGDSTQLHVPLMVGGEYRMSRKTKWLTENWVVPGEISASSLGIRRMGDRWTWDLGLMFLWTEQDVPFFPIVSVSYAFGQGR